MVTHNLEIVSDTDRVVKLVEGRVLEPEAMPRPRLAVAE
jgi:hypothetical protein